MIGESALGSHFERLWMAQCWAAPCSFGGLSNPYTNYVSVLFVSFYFRHSTSPFTGEKVDCWLEDRRMNNELFIMLHVP